jgi:hypothetical protein
MVPGWGLLPRDGCGLRCAAGGLGGMVVRAARDAGALWDAIPSESLALGS